MNLSALFLALLLTFTALSSAHARDKKAETSSPVSKAVRVEVKMKDVFRYDSAPSRIRFFVHTDSVEVPIICIADNAGFPAISQFSARERGVKGKDGVVVDIYFADAVSAESHGQAAISINLWQPNLAAKSFPVYPTDGRTFVGKKK